MATPMTPESIEDLDASAAAEPIAIVGMAARVPGAGNLRAFWRNLVDGVESVTKFTREEQLARGADPEDLDDPSWVNAAPIVADFDEFDAGLFGMSAREAEITDPQHRMFLESSYAALNDAGYDPARYPGAIGVYGGTGAIDYLVENLNRNRRILSSQRGGIGLATSNLPSYLATSVSYKLNLRGPSLTVATACSTSLVAMHLACEALRNGECDMALAGGVSVELPHGTGYHGTEGFTSPDAQCRPFDADASGTVWGSGVGMVVVKRLADAVADGDHIRAVVRGNAINNDGATKVGFSAPSVAGQTEAVAQAVGMADIDPRTISYVEAHGTGTALGDPLEITALSQVYGQHTDDRQWCGIGSVKSNIGHLSQAAGVVSVIKTVLALEHGLMPPSINYSTANPAIDFPATPFRVIDSPQKWEEQDHPRRAGVSSFGIGGTNAHVVLEEAPRRPDVPLTPPTERLLPVSARTESALARAVDQLADHLDADPELDLADVAHTLAVGRAEHRHRTAVVASTVDAAVDALRDTRRITGIATDSPPPVAMMFSGQGAQYAGMGADVYTAEPDFTAAVDRCADLLKPELDLDIRDLIFGSGTSVDEQLRQTGITQPALFTVEYALAMWWRARGVTPNAMIGHSIGEYVAATMAGVFDLSDALRLVAARGRLMQSMPAGAMLAVGLDEAEVLERLPADLAVATVNAPGTCVVAGAADAIERFAETLRPSDISAKKLRTSHAFHSPMMEPILGEFTDIVASMSRQAPTTPIVSNVTGGWLTEAEATDPSYWATHLRQPVRFGAGIATLLTDGPASHGPAPNEPASVGDWRLVECGPGRQLATMARTQLPAGTFAPITSLPGPNERTGGTEALLTAAGTLWCSGIDVDTSRAGAHRVSLPAYPFERTRYWVDPDPVDTAPGSTQPPSPARTSGADGDPRHGPLPLDDWFAVPTWRQDVAAPESDESTLVGAEVLVFAVETGDALVAGLRKAGASVTVVRPGTEFAITDDGFTVRPGHREDYNALVATGIPNRIVHAFAWTTQPAGLPADHPTILDPGVTRQAQERGFFSLLSLTQALTATTSTGHDDGVQIDVITTGTTDVYGGDLIHPEFATVAGIARVVPLELPEVQIRHLDTDPGTAVSDLVAEVNRPVGATTEVALRSGRRWIRDYAPVALPNRATPAAIDGGRYLITGGTGGIGITIAEDFAHRSRCTLILLSRTGLPPRAEWDEQLATHGRASRVGRTILAVGRMERAGARVEVVAADVTDAEDLRRVRRQIEAEHGGLDGIVHAAGLPGGGMIEVKDRADADRVLGPKVDGTVALAAAFGDLPMDFIALCSSVTAVSGDFGQVDYCAANAYLDAVARSGAGFAAPVVSHNWGGWNDVGMAAEVEAPTALRSSGGTAAESQVHAVSLDHPVLANRASTHCFGLVAASSHWLLDEHRIGDVPVVPGTGHLETVRAAVEATVPGSEGQRIQLRDVAFTEPFSVPDGAVAEYRVELSGDEFQVTSRIGGRTTVHVRGGASWVSVPVPEPIDVAAIRNRGTHVDEDNAFGSGRTSMLTFGPRWDALREHYVLDQEGVASEELAVIQAPTATAEDDGWVLHPSLLDVATAFGRGRGSGNYLPLSYGQITVHRPLPSRFVSHLRYRDGSDEVVSADLRLCDESGDVLVEIDDFVLRRVDQETVTGGITETAPTDRVDIDTPDNGIRPVDGAEAFRRALTPGLGGQVVISPVPVAELFARRVSTDDLADDAARSSGETPEHATPGAAVTGETTPEKAASGGAAPLTELQATLTQQWQDILGIDHVGIDDDFFALGGNSLIAVQIVAHIRRATGVRLPMRVLFEEPTVIALADRIEQQQNSTDDSADSAPAPSIPVLDRSSEGN